MTINELVKILNYKLENAQSREKITTLFLFGIKYHTEIKKVGIKQIIEQSGLSSGHYTELNKAINLAKYVEIKKQ